MTSLFTTFLGQSVVFIHKNHLSGVMFSVLGLSEVDCGFNPWSGQTEDFRLISAISFLDTHH